jgi:hypothetical protein
MNWFHRHGPWEVIGTSCDRQTHYLQNAGHYSMITNVAMRCKSCGAIRTKEFPGYFTIEELRGEATEVAKVLRDLERR